MFEPFTQPEPQPAGCNCPPCTTTKPKKDKKKRGPRTVCKRFIVKQLTRGQITSGVKEIPCESPKGGGKRSVPTGVTPADFFGFPIHI